MCFSAAVRGVTANWIILEEFAYIHEEVFKNLVLPLAIRENFVMVAISTVGNDTNHYSVLLNLRTPDGKRPFVVIQAIQACKSCIAKNKAVDCKHVKPPPWHQARNKEFIRLLHGENQDDFLRETVGIIANSSRTHAFAPYMKSYLESRPISFSVDPQTIFIGIDPSGGGMRSHYAIVAISKDLTTNQVVVIMLVYTYILSPSPQTLEC